MSSPVPPVSAVPVSLPPNGLDLEHTLRSYGPFVRRQLQLWRVPDGLVPDVQQEVFIAVAERLASFTPSPSLSLDGALKSWLSVISARQAWVCFAALRQQGCELPVAAEELESYAGSAAAADESYAAREQWTLLFALVNDLEPRRRAVFVAHSLEDRDMTEIARELGIPLATAWNRFRLAREDLQAAARRLSIRQSNDSPLLLLALLCTDELQAPPLSSEGLPPPRAPGVQRTSKQRVTLAAVAALLGFVLCWHRPPVPLPEPWPDRVVIAPLAMTPAPAPAPAPVIDAMPAVASPPPMEAAKKANPAAQVAVVPGAASRRAVALPIPASRTGPSPRRSDLAYFKEAREVLRDGRPDVVRWALTTHAAGFAVPSLAPEREVLSAALPAIDSARPTPEDTRKATEQ